MKYFCCRWLHSDPADPVELYSELDEQRRETRKVWIFADGHWEFASGDESHGHIWLGEFPVPELEEIAADPQFEPAEIAAHEFEAMWKQRHKHAR
jgi:hypothetical protein